MEAFFTFVLLDGLLLFGLFYGVTFLLALAQQHPGVQGLMRRLQSARLGSGNVYAAVAGAVTPFCTCSTIPVLSGMLRAGIRFGVSMTFLISSPLISEAGIIVMARYFGLSNTALFVALSFVFSIVVGILLDVMGYSRYLRPREEEVVPGEVVGGAGATGTVPWGVKVRFASVLARNELRSVAGYILVGLLIGGTIQGFIPEGWTAVVTEHVSPIALVPIMALIGVPLYFNMAAAVPVAFALAEKNFDVGAVMAFLVAGGALSTPELILLAKLFRPRLLVAYIVAMLSIAIVIGYIFSALN
jgi:uncharacterized membrane protein YraQ (UPF0718 family)